MILKKYLKLRVYRVKNLTGLLEQKMLLPIACILLALLVIGQLFGSTSEIIKLLQAPVNTPTAGKLVNDDTNKKTMTQGLKIALFGIYIPQKLNASNVRSSSLSLKLIGVMFSVKSDDSAVIIRLYNGDEKIFKVGDIIQGDIKILQIFVNGVIIQHDDILERLNLPKHGDV